jgi:tetratricopeptide (TPR) repeat protein
VSKKRKRKQKTGGPIPPHGSNPALADLRKRRATGVADLLHRGKRRATYNPALAHGNLGLLLEYAERWAEAIIQYNAALALDPTLTDVRIDLGRCYATTGDLGRARVEYETALHDPPSQVSTRGVRRLIPIGFQMWSYDRARFPWSLALGWAEEYVRREPQSALAHFQLGNVLRHAGGILEATCALEAALMLDPCLIRAWASLGQCHLQLGNPARASECHEAALRIPAVSPLDRVVRGETLILVGRVAEGCREYGAWDEVCERDREVHPDERPLWRSPRWTGQPLSGTLLLQPRGGSGDVFQRCSGTCP